MSTGFLLRHPSLQLKSVMWIKWCKHLIWWSMNLEHTPECVDYITAASAGVKNCCVNNCCITLSVCTVWLNRLTALSSLCYCDKMVWVSYPCLCVVYNAKRKVTVFYFFVIFSTFSTLFNCRNLIAAFRGGHTRIHGHK